MTVHDGTLTLDIPEGCIEAAARFSISAEWGPRSRGGYRAVEDADCALACFVLGAATLPREVAALILGEAEVERQEELALGDWLATASADEAGEWADYRHGMAAE